MIYIIYMYIFSLLFLKNLIPKYFRMLQSFSCSDVKNWDVALLFSLLQALGSILSSSKQNKSEISA